MIEFCRSHLAQFKAPRAVVFGELPKTSTGKIQKFVLRERAKSASCDRHMSAVPSPISRSCCARTLDGIVTLTMNRPQQMNLLTSGMFPRFKTPLRIARKRILRRVVILAAAGKGFCAGHDLKEIRALKELPKIDGSSRSAAA